jgi:hypothetical protein
MRVMRKRLGPRIVLVQFRKMKDKRESRVGCHDSCQLVMIYQKVILPLKRLLRIK